MDTPFTLESRDLPDDVKTALNNHYNEYGVGSSVQQKRKHWEKFFGECTITHVETDDEWVASYEAFWLADYRDLD